MNPWTGSFPDSDVVAVAVLDPAGRAVEMNRLFERLVGNRARAADGLSAPDWLSLCQQLQSGPVVGRFTRSTPRSAGTTLRGRAVREGGAVVLVAEIDVPDVVESNDRLAALSRESAVLQRELARQKMRLEATLAELRASEAALVHSHKMRSLSRLAGGMAHELNSPLTAVLLSAEVLEAALQDPDHVDLADARDCAATIGQAARAVATVVRGVRRFSGDGRRGAPAADVVECVDTALLTVARLAASCGVVVSVAHRSRPLGCPAGPDVCAAFAEVARNAVQASSRGGAVQIETWADATHACVSFRDHGPGVRADPPERVFEPFFTTRHVGDGPGLGLSVAWGVVVEDLGGEITLVDADPGTRVLVRIPFQARPDAWQTEST